MSPEGYGTISVTETGEKFCNQNISFKPDYSIQVTDLYLTDKSSGSDVKVTVNGVEKVVTRVGDGYTKRLRVDYSGTIDSSGIVIDVSYGASGIRPLKQSNRGEAFKSLRIKSVSEVVMLPQAWSGKKVSVKLYNIQGRLVAGKVFEKTIIDIEKEFISRIRFLLVKAGCID
jgi:FKBP-type peptidyl-prolyl cis-trans isomerase